MPGETKRSTHKKEKLWSVESNIDRDVELFTTGNDFLLDMQLIEYDCIASIAHVKMLARTGILTQKESDKLIKQLNVIRKRVANGSFQISPDQEDSHTAIEQFLTGSLGDLGKKIHTGRSRNDQVLTALRLYYKDQIKFIGEKIHFLQQAIKTFISKFGRIQYPGYTHTRKAMPSTFALWAGAYRDALTDDILLLKTVYKIIDQSPLGSGAGYGVPVKLDRTFTAKELGFSKVQKNSLYAQHSRGKFEGLVIHSLSQVMYELNRCASDIILFSMPEIGYIDLPDNFTTGSSIMPQKKNPDVLELIRAKYHTVLSAEIQVRSITANLISGYHRDFQETKEPIIRSFLNTSTCITMMAKLFKSMTVNPDACAAAMTDELYATGEVYALVEKGVPFRDAYIQVAKKYK